MEGRAICETGIAMGAFRVRLATGMGVSCAGELLILLAGMSGIYYYHVGLGNASYQATIPECNE